MDEIFHPGERAAQALAGESATADRNGAILALQLVPGALPFLGQQRLIVLTAEHNAGALWTTVTFGRAGFVTATERTSLRIDRSLALPSAHDPVWEALRPGVPIGALAIDLSTRRRLRINGIVSKLNDAELAVHIEEAFANCPKYITQRHIQVARQPVVSPVEGLRHGTALDADLLSLIERADMLFLGSTHADRGLDSSHRGGHPGFVQVLGNNRLRLPDYKGNGMFQSFGNLLLDRRASIAIPDLSANQVLHLSGWAEVHWREDDPDERSGGTGRFLEFTVEQWRLTRLPTQVISEMLGYSPFLPA